MFLVFSVGSLSSSAVTEFIAACDSARVGC